MNQIKQNENETAAQLQRLSYFPQYMNSVHNFHKVLYYCLETV